MIVQTMFVMGQNINDAALSDAALSAGADHLLDLDFERREPLDPALDRPKMLPRQGINLGTRSLRLVGEMKQFSYRFDFEAKLPGMSDELQTPHCPTIILAPVALGARGGG